GNGGHSAPWRGASNQSETWSMGGRIRFTCDPVPYLAQAAAPSIPGHMPCRVIRRTDTRPPATFVCSFLYLRWPQYHLADRDRTRYALSARPGLSQQPLPTAVLARDSPKAQTLSQ